VKAAL